MKQGPGSLPSLLSLLSESHGAALLASASVKSNFEIIWVWRSKNNCTFSPSVAASPRCFYQFQVARFICFYCDPAEMLVISLPTLKFEFFEFECVPLLSGVTAWYLAGGWGKSSIFLFRSEIMHKVMHKFMDNLYCQYIATSFIQRINTWRLFSLHCL